MITVLVRVVKASRMIVIFTASHDDRFHSTPVETTRGNNKRERETQRIVRRAEPSSSVSCQLQLDELHTQTENLSF